MQQWRLLHTIAHRDRAAEAAARCSDSPVRPVSGLISRRWQQRAMDRAFPHLRCSGRKIDPLLLTYRCGGSAGLDVSISPASRFTRGVNPGHLTQPAL